MRFGKLGYTLCGLCEAVDGGADSHGSLLHQWGAEICPLILVVDLAVEDGLGLTVWGVQLLEGQEQRERELLQMRRTDKVVNEWLCEFQD